MNDADMIATKPLELVAAWMHHKIQADPAWMDGAAMAVLAKRLIAAEATPGGPYKDERGLVKESLNRCVAELFQALGAPLPKVEAYLASISVQDAPFKLLAPPLINTRILHNDARMKAAAMIGVYAVPLRTEASHMYERILSVDRSGELSQLAEWFCGSVKNVHGIDLTALGAANLLAWMAYSAFDELLDGDGSPRSLPVANAMHRDAVALYQNNTPLAYAELAVESFRLMDEANAWELARCRFAVNGATITIGRLPKYGNYAMLAHRAAAHVLGPLIITYHADALRPYADTIRRSLYDYLIARQYNDDLHDWMEDVARGHISPVVASLIEAARIRPGRHRIAGCIAQMKKAFWDRGLSDQSEVALASIRRSQSRLIEAGIMNGQSPFIKNALQRVEASLIRGLTRHARDKSFLEFYRN